MPLDASAILARYQRGVQNGSQSYREGVTGKGGTWKTNAQSDQAEARYAAGVQRAAQQKSRQKGVAAVQATDWETAAANIGATNYAASATKAATNYQRVVQDVIGAATAGQNAAAAVPGATIADRLNRSTQSSIAIHRYWAQKKGISPEV